MASSDERSDGRPDIPTIAAAVAVLAAGVLANRFFLDAQYRATDTLSLIRQGTVGTVGDVGRIFSEELLAGTSFRAGPYYRPISVLSYGLDHAAWGLNPLGYNLTNTILHALVALMTFAVVLRLGRSLVGAVVAGMVVALHPLVVETVPAPARRHDMIAALFVLVALALVARTVVGRLAHPVRAALAPASVALVLAVWSKETAVVGILPLLVLLWFGAGDRLPLRDRVLAWGRQAVPLVVGLVLALGVRAAVIGGGGDASVEGASDPVWQVTTQVGRLLLQPQRSFVPFAAVGWLAAAVVGLVVIVGMAGRLRGEGRMIGATAAMSSSWIAGLIVLMAVTGEFSSRTLYSALPAFGMLVGITAGAVTRALHTWALAVPAGVALLLVVVSVAAESPAIHDYEQWHAAGRLTASTLDALDTWDLRSVGGGATVHVPVLPRRIGPGDPPLSPRVGSPTVLVAHALRSYLEMRHPGVDVRVEADRYSQFPPRAGVVVTTTRERGDPARLRLDIVSVPVP